LLRSVSSESMQVKVRGERESGISVKGRRVSGRCTSGGIIAGQGRTLPLLQDIEKKKLDADKEIFGCESGEGRSRLQGKVFKRVDGSRQFYFTILPSYSPALPSETKINRKETRGGGKGRKGAWEPGIGWQKKNPLDRRPDTSLYLFTVRDRTASPGSCRTTVNRKDSGIVKLARHTRLYTYKGSGFSRIFWRVQD